MSLDMKLLALILLLPLAGCDLHSSTWEYVHTHKCKFVSHDPGYDYYGSYSGQMRHQDAFTEYACEEMREGMTLRVEDSEGKP